jgi:hypothetical protein
MIEAFNILYTDTIGDAQKSRLKARALFKALTSSLREQSHKK